MTYEEIQNKIEEILHIKNICEMVIALNEFKKEYKNSEFYKQTKMSLEDLMKFYKTIHLFDWQDMFGHIQDMITNLNYEQLDAVLTTFSDNAAQITQEFKQQLGDMKDLI